MAASLSGGWVERIFPVYDDTLQYKPLGLLTQIAGQAAVNGALAQATLRRFVFMYGRTPPRAQMNVPA